MFLVVHCDVHPFLEILLRQRHCDARQLLRLVQFYVLQPLFPLQIAHELLQQLILLLSGELLLVIADNDGVYLGRGQVQLVRVGTVQLDLVLRRQFLHTLVQVG